MARVGRLDGWTKSADTISATSDVTRSGKFKRHFDSDAASCFLNLMAEKLEKSGSVSAIEIFANDPESRF
jgi:hypothetical protein